MRTSRSLLVVLVLLAGAAVATPTTASARPTTPQAGPARVTAHPVSSSRSHRYIVATRSARSTARSATRVRASGGQVGTRFRRAFRGFTATMTPTQAARLRHSSGVTAVVRDRRTSAGAIQTQTQTQAPWGLDRIDQHPDVLTGRYSYDTTGEGVTVFVIDSGIRMTHEQFGGRAASGYDFVDHDSDASDCNGHGTHVAGTIGGSTYGVAKGVTLVSLRVWDCQGSGWFSDMIGAIDWAVAHRPAGRSVINISGGGISFEPLDEAVDRAVAADIPVVVAAMNDATEACTSSPADAPAAITVAAVDSYDQRASFSDFGSCVDLFAPGTDILSSINTSDTASGYDSGTSMATPHVTGAIARTLQARPTLSPAAVAARLAATATIGVVEDAQDSPNRLLYVSPRQFATNT